MVSLSPREGFGGHGEATELMLARERASARGHAASCSDPFHGPAFPPHLTLANSRPCGTRLSPSELCILPVCEESSSLRGASDATTAFDWTAEHEQRLCDALSASEAMMAALSPYTSDDTLSRAEATSRLALGFASAVYE